jgi:hypothetical protein
MANRPFFFAFASLLALLAAAPAPAQELPIYEAEFWIELEPAVAIEGVDLSDGEEQARLLLEEARFVFSGMLYGFEFRYVPLDLRREVAEEFEITPLAEIRWGDPRLSITESRYRNGRRYVFIRYTVAGEQAAWVRYWGSNIHAVSAAYGTGNVFSGQEEKYAAVREGLKESIRAYARSREYNKPREISGRVAFASAPYIIIDSGEYRAKVESKLAIRSVIPYRTY